MHRMNGFALKAGWWVGLVQGQESGTEGTTLSLGEQRACVPGDPMAQSRAQSTAASTRLSKHSVHTHTRSCRELAVDAAPTTGAPPADRARCSSTHAMTLYASNRRKEARTAAQHEETRKHKHKHITDERVQLHS